MRRGSARPRIKTKLPGPKTRKLVDFHSKYAALSTFAYPFVWDITKPATGPFCTDPDGNVFMDFVSQIGAAPLGYNNKEILDIFEPLKIDPVKMAGQDFYFTPSKRFSKKSLSASGLQSRLIDLTKKFGFDTVFLSNSGAEAVENAIKICYDYRGEGHGITFKGAFHGRTLGALSLNRSRDVYRKGFPAIPGVLDLPYCSCRDACDCGWVTWKDGDKKTALEQILETICPDEISYIILEPVQGEGGYNIPNKDFMSKIGEIKEKYGIPLISDEVQTGLGRTGKFWAIEHFGVEPDVITAAKGLRVGATISSKEIFPKEKSRISSTWGAGDIINSAIACKTLDIIKKKKLVKNAARMGKYFLDELASLQDEYEIITDVRGLGLMDAIEFETKEQRDRAELECFRNGLLTLLCGYKTLRFLPPLDVRKREIDLAIEILDDVLKNI